jgi:16S rRNA (uracil1498-N3)-methyltransferase
MAGPAAPAPSVGRNAPLVFVDDLREPVLSTDDRHHLERVLRLGPGQPLTVSDGNGSWRSCSFGRDLEVTSPVYSMPMPTPTLTVAFSIPKGDRPELTVQKLTELGVDRIVLLRAERTVVRWDGERALRHLDRLRRVAREAAMQSRRCRLPEVTGPLDVTTMAAMAGTARCEPGGDPPTLDHPVLLVGPEGGWSHGEQAEIGCTVGLGPHILRVETAALAAGMLLSALRSGLVFSTPIVVNDAVRG